MVRPLPGDLRHEGHRQCVDLPSLDDRGDVARVIHFRGKVRPEGATAGLGPQPLGLVAIGVEQAVDDAPIGVVSRLYHHRAGAVAEENETVAGLGVLLELLGRYSPIDLPQHRFPGLIRPRNQRCVHLRSDDQYFAMLTGADQGVGKLQRIHETGALLADIEARDVFEAELALQERCRTGEVVVRCHGCEHQIIDVFGFQPGVFDRLAACRNREVRGRLVWRRELSFDNPGPHLDPLVRGVHDPREGVVVDTGLGDVHTGPGDHRTHGRLLRTQL